MLFGGVELLEGHIKNYVRQSSQHIRRAIHVKKCVRCALSPDRLVASRPDCKQQAHCRGLRSRLLKDQGLSLLGHFVLKVLVFLSDQKVILSCLPNLHPFPFPHPRGPPVQLFIANPSAPHAFLNVLCAQISSSSYIVKLMLPARLLPWISSVNIISK